jgi:hypothetical protein
MRAAPRRAPTPVRPPTPKPLLVPARRGPPVNRTRITSRRARRPGQQLPARWVGCLRRDPGRGRGRARLRRRQAPGARRPRGRAQRAQHAPTPTPCLKCGSRRAGPHSNRLRSTPARAASFLPLSLAFARPADLAAPQRPPGERKPRMRRQAALRPRWDARGVAGRRRRVGGAAAPRGGRGERLRSPLPPLPQQRAAAMADDVKAEVRAGGSRGTGWRAPGRAASPPAEARAPSTPPPSRRRAAPRRAAPHRRRSTSRSRTRAAARCSSA